MNPHHIELPRKILIGNNIIEKIPEVTEELNLRGNALILADEITEKIAGNQIKELLNNSILEHSGQATFAEYSRITSKHKNIDYVISTGGGRIIDMGKYIAFKKSIPFISIPTAPSHDGITSDRVSFGEKNSLKHSLRAVSPIAIVADINIIKNAPEQLISSGSADVISNHSAVHDWKLSRDRTGEYFSPYAADLALLSANFVMESAESIRNREERGIRNLVEALISSGISMSLAQSSRPASGAEHMFSHALDLLGSKGLHGHQCGLGSIITSYLQGSDWAKIRYSLKQAGAPVTAESIGIGKGMIVDAVLGARQIRDRYTILNMVDLSKEKVEKICSETGVF